MVDPISAFFASVFVSAGVGAGTAAFLGAAIANIAIGTGFLLLSRAIAGRPTLRDPSDRLVTLRQAVTPMQHAYGRIRTSGPLGFWGFADNPPRRVYTVILSSDQIRGVVAHVLDDRVVSFRSNRPGESNIESGRVEEINTSQSVQSISATPWVQNKEFVAIGGSHNSFARLAFRAGSLGQSAIPILYNAFDQLSASTSNYSGLAYTMIEAYRPAPDEFNMVYPTGREWNYAPIIEGKVDIFDPRSNTTGYSNNAALVFANWITSDWGLAREVDWPSVATEANAADSLGYEINAMVYEDEPKEQVQAAMGTAMDAFIYERLDGKVGFFVGRWMAPTVTLTDNNFIEITVSDGDTGSNAVNQQTVSYIEPSRAFNETTTSPATFGDQTPPIRENARVFYCTNLRQASRIAKRLILAKRARYKLRATVNYAGIELIGQRFFRVNHTELAINETFEVSRIIRNADALTFEVEGYSVNQSDFSFGSGDLLSITDSVLDRPIIIIPTPQNLQATIVGTGASLVGSNVSIRVTWDRSVDTSLTTRVRFTEGGETTTVNIDDPTQTSYVITNADFGERYDINVTFVNFSGEQSPTPATTSVTTGGVETPSGLALTLVQEQGSALLQVGWTAPSNAGILAEVSYSGGTVTTRSNSVALPVVFDTDYTIRLTFIAPSGQRSVTITRNISVPENAFISQFNTLSTGITNLQTQINNLDPSDPRVPGLQQQIADLQNQINALGNP